MSAAHMEALAAILAAYALRSGSRDVAGSLPKRLRMLLRATLAPAEYTSIIAMAQIELEVGGAHA